MAIVVSGSNPRVVTLTYSAPNAQMDARLTDAAHEIWQDIRDAEGNVVTSWNTATTNQRLAQLDDYLKRHVLALAASYNTRTQAEAARATALAENASKYGT